MTRPRDGDHAALMDRVYRHQRHIYDLTRKFYLAGRDRLIRRLAPAPGARIVEVGCGTARNLIRIARAYPDVELFGLDASHEMLRSAEAATRRAGFANRIRLAHGYAENLDPGLFGEPQPFDAAVFSYSLSMIPDWRRALAAAGTALAPQGSVYIVDFGDFSGLPGVLRRGLAGWLGLFHVAPRTELMLALDRLRADYPSVYIDVLPFRYAFLARLPRDAAARRICVAGPQQNSPN